MNGHLSDSHLSAWLRLARAGQGCLGAIEADLKAAGHPPLLWYDVLLELRRAPRGRLLHSEIGGKISLSKSNVTRVVDRLEAKELVRREACRKDRRSAFVIITEAGRALQKRMWPDYRASLARHVGACLSEEEAGQLAALLGRLGCIAGTAAIR